MVKQSIFKSINFTYEPNSALATITAEENGVQIKQTDYFFKNEIAVTVSGSTHTLETPNVSSICLLFVIVLFLILTFSSMLLKYIFKRTNDTQIQQIKENNQEIHELNKKFDELENRFNKLQNN